jgi:hypothetical protein
LVGVGRNGVRAILQAYVASGLSKFVVRPTERGDSLDSEVRWLADAILDLQT